MEFAPGAEIAGYRIESVIGRGGMAVVYRAEDSRLGRKVALKLLAPVLAQNQHFQQRFIRESRLAASLDHPNIVPIYEAGESDGHLFIAMRYVPGSDLKAVLAHEQRLSQARLLRLFVQIGDALDAAHLLGLVHRDVKPGNILVSSVVEHSGHARPDHVYLTDFGLTKRTSSLSGSLTDTGHFLGTVDYVSPEQIQGGPLSPATDTYALGCVLYECLTGQLPFNRDDDAAVLWAHLVEAPPPVTAARPDLSPAVDDVVNRAMAKAPEDRYDSCSDLMRDLEQALEAGTDFAGLDSASARPAARHRRATGADLAGLPRERAGSPLPVETAPPPPVDPDATRGWVSHPSLPPGAMEPPRWPRPGDDAYAAPEAPDETGGLPGYDAVDQDVAQEANQYGDQYGDQDGDQDGDHDAYDDSYAEAPERDPAEAVVTEPATQRPRRSAGGSAARSTGGRRRWLLPAALLVVLALVAASAAYLVRSRQPEALITFTASSQDSAVGFSIDHPDTWGKASSGNEFMLAPRASQLADVFTGQGGWGAARDVIRSSPSDAIGLYATSSTTPLEPTGTVLQDWIGQSLQNSSVSGLSSPTPTTIGTLRGYVLEGDLKDVQAPDTTLHAIFDVVVVPSKGTLVLTFLAPPQQVDKQRQLFDRMLGTVKLLG
ncbi:serine/threonine-protein kinase [Phycicoccus sp. Soil748]|uniref:serine/threonine-protein kinase n=1 Tax=Intrasporangiaceae TaxID=85021 RepID=UPI000ACCD74F|nr:serine/threonine-protein kinase [Phycicoccus sp. Soil748]